MSNTDAFEQFPVGSEVQTRNNHGALQWFMKLDEAIEWAEKHTDHRRGDYVWKISYNDTEGKRRRFIRHANGDWQYDPIQLPSGAILGVDDIYDDEGGTLDPELVEIGTEDLTGADKTIATAMMAEGDDDYISNCPVCGSPMDYCQGHGEIGDPRGWAIQLAHDDGNHDSCHPDGCEYAKREEEE